MFLPIPIGVDDFRVLRERGLAYVDKSSLIRALLDEPGIQVMLLPRPRRFGKTLNLSMLRCFFEKRDEDLSHLFQDLSIWRAGDAYRADFQRYPVIHFNFKGTKGESFEHCWTSIREKIVDLYHLSIPNREVRGVYTTTFQRWMKARIEARGGSLEKLTAALLGGDAPRLQEQLQAFVTDLLSYQDPGAIEPERVYHGFVLGLLAVMEPEYLVRSNRESGDGRPDVMIRPREPGKPSAVLELKVARKGEKTPATALREGLAQIRARRYEAELLSSGASAVHAFAVAFDGKRVWIKAAGAAPARRAKAGAQRRGAGRKRP